MFFDSDAVLVAKVLSRANTDNDESVRFEVRVSRVLRGEVEPKADVYTSNDSGRLSWDVGREYVVFASRRGGRLWSGDDCGPLSDSAKVTETLEEIGKLRRATRSSIEGDVLSGLPVSSGVPGVLVRATGDAQTYEGKSDQHGKFRIDVPPGRYEVTVADRFTQFDVNELTHGTTKVSLVAGQCRQFQFVPH